MGSGRTGWSFGCDLGLRSVLLEDDRVGGLPRAGWAGAELELFFCK